MEIGSPLPTHSTREIFGVERVMSRPVMSKSMKGLCKSVHEEYFKRRVSKCEDAVAWPRNDSWTRNTHKKCRGKKGGTGRESEEKGGDQ